MSLHCFARSLMVLVAATAFGGPASAATLVVNCGTVSGPTELASAAVLCPQFNPATGTVYAISITISGAISGSITLTNGDDQSHTAVGTTTSQYSVGALTGFNFVNPLFTNSFTSGNRSLNAGQTLTISGLTSSAGNASLGANTTTFAPYVGGGNFTVPFSTATSFTSTGEGGFFMSAQATNANATAVVTYGYTPPGSAPYSPTLAELISTVMARLTWRCTVPPTERGTSCCRAPISRPRACINGG